MSRPALPSLAHIVNDFPPPSLHPHSPSLDHKLVRPSDAYWPAPAAHYAPLESESPLPPKPMLAPAMEAQHYHHSPSPPVAHPAYTSPGTHTLTAFPPPPPPAAPVLPRPRDLKEYGNLSITDSLFNSERRNQAQSVPRLFPPPPGSAAQDTTYVRPQEYARPTPLLPIPPIKTEEDYRQTYHVERRLSDPQQQYHPYQASPYETQPRNIPPPGPYYLSPHVNHSQHPPYSQAHSYPPYAPHPQHVMTGHAPIISTNPVHSPSPTTSAAASPKSSPLSPHTKIEPSARTDATQAETVIITTNLNGTTKHAKLYRCPSPNCMKMFTRRYNLQSHMRCHSGERPFVCKSCGTTFSRKHDLRRHMRSLHSEDRPHCCAFCSLSFARSDALKRHLASEAKRCSNHPPYPPAEKDSARSRSSQRKNSSNASDSGESS